jgi:hypothetical protein
MDRPEQSLAMSFSRAREAREDAAALRGESRQARRRAVETRAETNVILETVAEMIARALRRRGFALRAPVAARFRTERDGVEIVVRLEAPSDADAAKAAIVQRFPDALSDVMVS